MTIQAKNNIWPTMITPYTDEKKPDLRLIPEQVDWYIRKGCNGLFAVCQSSEMHLLSEQEKIDLAKAVIAANGGRVPVAASGHCARDINTQYREIEAMMKTGVDFYVLVSNTLDPENLGDGVFLENFYTIVNKYPEIRFGIYECPVPYKRLVSTPALKEIAESGRLVFLKDTCCDNDLIRERIEAVKHTPLKLFNANAATFYDSIVHGAAGYNGIMANYHPQLYKYVEDNLYAKPEKAKLIGDLITELAMVEMRLYPVSAKYHMQLEGIPMNLFSRAIDCGRFDKNARMEVDSMYALERYLDDELDLSGISG